MGLPVSDGPHPGHRHRRRRAQAVPLPRPLARAPRPREVRVDGGVRARPAAPAQAREEGPPPRGHAARAGAGLRGPSARSRLLPDRLRGLRRGERHLRDRHDGEAPRDGRGRRGELRLRGQGRPAPAAVIGDPEVAAVVRQLKRRRGGGEELLAWKEGRRWTDVKSRDVNAYVKEAAGREFSAKDFRTWSATVLAAVALAVSGVAAGGSKTARKRAKTRAIKETAALPRQHARGLPRLLHRPARVRPLRRRPHDRRGAAGAGGGHRRVARRPGPWSRRRCWICWRATATRMR